MNDPDMQPTTDPDDPGGDAVRDPAEGVQDAPDAAAETPPDDGDAPERVYTEADVAALLAAKDAEVQDRYLRLAAEYQNFRRRVEREKEQLSDEALERFVKDLIPVLDSFDRALTLRGTDPAGAASGIELVDRQLKAALEKNGVTIVDPADGTFDPAFHEAMFRTATTDRPPGAILAVLEKGWKMQSRLLRPARVQVASAPDRK